MADPTQINQGGAQIQERQPKEQTGSRAGIRSTDDPTAGDEAQKRRDKMGRQEKAEGD